MVYGGTSGIEGYARRGALVVAGRTNYADPAIKRIAAAGGTVLIYLNPIIQNDFGRYHSMLYLNSACGPATPAWPWDIHGSVAGRMSDFRADSVLQQKLECVLETMVRENPHMGGFFADDVGSKSWFPNVDWSAWTAGERAAYRDGAVQLMNTFRTVADRHRLIVIDNGTWNGGLAAGGGYPDVDQNGNAVVDGAYIEYHDTVDQFMRNYTCGGQWARRSRVTAGRTVHFVVTHSAAASRVWAGSGCIAYVATQQNYEEDRPAPWGSFYDRGLPSAAS
jgi:hypothetical protein